MRKKVSDTILCFDGKNGEWLCRIIEISKNEIKLKILQQTKEHPQDVDLWLCFALVKNTPLSNIIQKATELGVSKFIPLITEYTNSSRINFDRLKIIAVEASEQSDRLSVPEFDELTKLTDLLKNWQNNRDLIYCDESGSGKPFNQLLTNDKSKKSAILIGPEGGFSENEFEMINSYDYARAVGLGPRILRADTAAIAAISCYMSQNGDWHEKPNFKPE